MENISTHITYDEATKSPTAEHDHIDNAPTAEILSKMKVVAINCFEPARKWWDKPLIVNSFYRCKALNTAIGGAANSQHMKGEAIDMSTGDRANNLKLLEWCKANLKFDQIICEFPDENGCPAWVHISYTLSAPNRNEVLYAKKVGNQTVYYH